MDTLEVSTALREFGETPVNGGVEALRRQLARKIAGMPDPTEDLLDAVLPRPAPFDWEKEAFFVAQEHAQAGWRDRNKPRGWPPYYDKLVDLGKHCRPGGGEWSGHLLSQESYPVAIYDDDDEDAEAWPVQKYIRVRPPPGGAYTAEFLETVFTNAVTAQTAATVDFELWQKQADDLGELLGRAVRNVVFVLNWPVRGAAARWWMACENWVVSPPPPLFHAGLRPFHLLV